MKDLMQSGLTAGEVAVARQEFGPNEMPKLPPPPWWKTALRQLESPLVWILVAAVVAAAALGETIDAAVIAAVIILNAALGFAQEWRAERALAALTAMLDPMATVRRDGRETVIPAREIVPGDILILSTGDRVAADGTIVSAQSAEVDESILTGESVPVSKSSGDLVSAGTSLVAGLAEARITATGVNTGFAEIAKLTGGLDRRPTQLQVALARLAKWLGFAAVAVALTVAAIGMIAGQDLLDMTLTAISLAVAMVPEGLPAVVTITLALGAGAMVRRQALVRRMQAVETLGASSVICTDKTGTLTENKMVATSAWVDGALHEIATLSDEPAAQALFGRLGRVGRLCSHASVSEDAHGNVQEIGSPTEIALLRFAQAAPDIGSGDILLEVPFSSERKRMSVLLRTDDGFRLLVKGAPEVVLERATHIAYADADRSLDGIERGKLEAALQSMGSKGLRVIALAERSANSDSDTEEEGLTILGLVGLIDPPRKEVADAIALAKAAGIRVIMITGDSPVTAGAIARDLAIACDTVLTGLELKDLSDDDLVSLMSKDVLFARTRPADKLRIVTALQARGEVVAMTGDGVNDAPALKRSDIGIAMGQRGTDVAQEAADVILLDDNFATIVGAIDEGRRQFANIKKFVRYLLSSNAGEVVALVVNLLIGGPLIFLATQILWMNLVTDGVTAVALGLEKAEPDQMKAPPRKPATPILGLSGLALIVTFGLYTGTASLVIFYTFLSVDPALANTMAFTAMVVFEKVSVFAFRSLTSPVIRIGWTSNPLLLLALTLTLGLQVAAVYLPFFQTILHTVPLSASNWLWIIGLALPLIIVPELVKLARVGRQKR
ncbi:cation-translocating P-type ATPase [Pseudaestuariivita atlantica]|uniref:ATPase P n=1 Tax=Pseudaestuariivita atlantica TaxID=1317121 RepID=A0A0L1JJC2_9RHOB|nr:cation-transporting P-type ATPase [Pseudaestuariivita atlantica]KNG91864.1 ATPase P [Pseudaestuariivita atlantica]